MIEIAGRNPGSWFGMPALPAAVSEKKANISLRRGAFSHSVKNSDEGLDKTLCLPVISAVRHSSLMLLTKRFSVA
ncbi:hypothetical protein, partial [Stenotrophomonas maltophilia group sp. RNC7]|uniref:hypothetical protein n=1 Tax=Stenotrophomonas maltophilia group sp. RNC7 TaxID=3071467 RepID=UPI0027E05FA7